VTTPSKLLYLLNDFVVQEHVCNLRCTYCLNFENENLKGGTPWVPLERINLKPDTKGWHRAHQVLDRCRELADAPILRVAGGEIMAIPGGVDFIEQVAPNWERVQVLTNATFLQKDIGRLATISSLNLCCSVDGHTVELNAQRTPVKNWAQRIIDGFLAAVQASVPVEVYTVLTEHNVEGIYDFACYLAELTRKSDLRLLPFPVRGIVAERMGPRREQYAALEKLVDEYDQFAAILPPRAYMTRLLDVCLTGRRSYRCRVPLSFMQTFDDGVIASCSNCWASPLGNVLDDETVFTQVGEANIHKLFLRNPPRFPFCKGCFTPFDVVNVYLDGECSLDDIAGMDLYSSPGVRARLQQLREAWAGDGAKAVWQATKLPSEREKIIC
jgi:molybdenum cofactor biosynthesis enzyme MoaA